MATYTKYLRAWKGLNIELPIQSRKLRMYQNYHNRISTLMTPSGNWESVIGLEIHAQIKTNSKLLSGSANSFASPANSLVSFFDSAIPGTLPVLNKKSVEAALLTALALNCKINLISEFDRKHYFYADMPAGYQITQQRLPFATNGIFTFGVFSSAVHKVPYKKQSRIKQLQLEQDSGKSIHEESNIGSLIDLNRAGVGLMEIVFEPDLKDGEEAVALVSELIRVLQTLDTCNCKMEEGSLRVDANVSVKRIDEGLGTRTEIKNLNSLRAVARSIQYEIVRQIRILESGGKVLNETRGYDPTLKITLPMRDKEEKQDYRYMPEPNLLPLNLSCLSMSPSDYRMRIPILPDTKRNVLMEKYGLTLEIAMQIVNGGYATYFEDVMKSSSDIPVKKVCSLFLTDLIFLLNRDEKSIDECPVQPKQFAEIIELLKTKTITHSTGQRLLSLLYHGDFRSPKQIVIEEKLDMITDPQILRNICLRVIEENPKLVASFRSGKSKAFGGLRALLKKDSNDRFDMGEATKLLKELLENQ